MLLTDGPNAIEREAIIVLYSNLRRIWVVILTRYGHAHAASLKAEEQSVYLANKRGFNNIVEEC